MKKLCMYVACCLVLAGCNDDRPSLIMSNTLVNEGEVARVRVSLSKASYWPVSVNYSTRQDTAQEANDYTKTTGELTFSSNETEKYILVRTMSTGTYKPNAKKLHVAFTNPTNVKLSTRNSTVSIINQVRPVITIDTDQLAVDADAEVALRAKLSRPSATPVTANCVIKDISDTEATVIEDAVMRFEPGETLKQIKIPTKIKNSSQLQKSLRIELSKPLHATMGDLVIANVTVKQPQQVIQAAAPVSPEQAIKVIGDDESADDKKEAIEVANGVKLKDGWNPATAPTDNKAITPEPSPKPEQKTPSDSGETADKGEENNGQEESAQSPATESSDLPEDITITVSYANNQVNQGRNAKANVTLSHQPKLQEKVIVEYQTVSDSALKGEDFKNTVGQLIFNADNYSQPQTVEVSTYYNFANTEPKTLKIVFSKQASNTSSNQSISIINTQQPNTENTLNFKIKEFDKIKTFSFEWAKDPNASYYRLLEKLEGKNSYWPVARIDDTNTSNYEYTPALIALVGATYVLEACGSDDQCVWSNQVKTKRLINKGIGYFKASNSGTSDHFGQSVSLSADGKTLAVGAWREASGYKGILSGTQIDSNDNNDPHNKNTGAVYIFSLKDNGWAQQAYITPENVGSKDYFGYSVSLSANGDTLAVGATGEDSHVSKRTKLDDDTYIITGDNRDYSDLSDEEKNQYKNHGKNSGAVYTFKRLDSEWQKSHFIKPDSVEIDANFGSVVDLSADGKTLAVVARDGGGDEKKHGTAYIFSFKKTEWTQDQIFVGKNKKENDNFGFAVDLSGNGKVLAVGAYSEEDEDDINNNGGVAYIFRQNSNGTWPAGYERRFVGQKQTGYFGHAVGLNYQGDILAIGARGAGDSSVYIYTHTHKNSTWEAYQQNPLYAANGDLSDAFGASLSFSDDGTQLLVGASGESSGASGVYSQQDPNIADKASDNSLYANGAVYLFILSNSTWQQKAYIKPARHQENISKGGANYYAEPENDFAEITGFDQQFGSSLSLSGDGRTLAIGAAQEHSEFKGISSGKQDSQQTNDKFRSGAVYVY